jgi:hypothetical protein
MNVLPGIITLYMVQFIYNQLKDDLPLEFSVHLFFPCLCRISGVLFIP